MLLFFFSAPPLMYVYALRNRLTTALCCLSAPPPVYAVGGSRLELGIVRRQFSSDYYCIASNGWPPAVSKRVQLRVKCEYRVNYQLSCESTVCIESVISCRYCESTAGAKSTNASELSRCHAAKPKTTTLVNCVNLLRVKCFTRQ